MKRWIIALLTLLLAGATLPVSPVRADWRFWNMLTPLGRDVLAAVPILAIEDCETIVHGDIGGEYDATRNAITVCGPSIAEFPDDILRHEALHALDWSDGAPYAGGKEISGQLVAAASAQYPGFLRSPEVFATIPLVIDWQFELLPDEAASLYAPWFTAAQR